MDRAASPAPVQRVPAAGWPALAGFIWRHNRALDGGVRCLHFEQGDSVEQHARELSQLPAADAAFWMAAGPDGSAQAVAGCEFDPVLGRAWLRGPLVGDRETEPVLAPMLLHALEQGLPQLSCFDAFPSEADPALNALYEAAGYRRIDVHRVLRAPLQGMVLDADPRVHPGVPENLPGLLALHHRLFPSSYLKDADIADALADPERLVRVVHESGSVAGYLVAQHEPDADEVYVDYLGVDESRRGSGLGRALVQSAMRWGRALGRGHAALTVRQDRLPALSLYRRCGFAQISAGVQWRKERIPA